MSRHNRQNMHSLFILLMFYISEGKIIYFTLIGVVFFLAFPLCYIASVQNLPHHKLDRYKIDMIDVTVFSVTNRP